MKNRLFLFILVFAVLFSCRENRKDPQSVEKIEVKSEANAVVKEVDNTERARKVFQKFKNLYSELLEFKGEPKFKRVGFKQGDPYYNWLVRVENLMSHPDSKLLLQKGILAGELEQLGLAYASSKGQETEVTKTFNKIFSNAISEKPVEKVENASGDSNYNKLKKDYKLFGKWEIRNTITKSSFPYEIYKRGADYIGVTPVNDFKTEKLKKKGNKFFVRGNKYGEYYVITTSKEMTLFDRDGELRSAGYVAVKR